MLCYFSCIILFVAVLENNSWFCKNFESHIEHRKFNGSVLSQRSCRLTKIHFHYLKETLKICLTRRIYDSDILLLYDFLFMFTGNIINYLLLVRVLR